MKNIRIFIQFMVLGFAIAACSPDDLEEQQPLGSNLLAITGNWELYDVVQIDETLDSENTRSVMRFYKFDDITLEVGEMSAEGMASFSVMNPANAPWYVDTEGTLSVDNPETPTLVNLTKTGSSEITNTLYLNRTPRSSSNLELRLTRTDNTGKAFLSYVYYFKRITE